MNNEVMAIFFAVAQGVVVANTFILMFETWQAMWRVKDTDYNKQSTASVVVYGAGYMTVFMQVVAIVQALQATHLVDNVYFWNTLMTLTLIALIAPSRSAYTVFAQHVANAAIARIIDEETETEAEERIAKYR